MFQSLWSSIVAIHLFSLTGLMGCGFDSPLDAEKRERNDKRVFPLDAEEPAIDPDDYPKFTGLPSEMCSDVSYYDANNLLTQGTLNCSASDISDPNLIADNIKEGITVAGISGSFKLSPVACQTDGETQCVANSDFPAVSSTDLASKVRAGQIVAGVTGTFIGGSYSACSAQKALGCLASSDFPAIDKSILSPANIRAGLVIAGVTGGYPSASHRLLIATDKPDLTSLGPASAVGAYEFFDSAGNRYETEIADGGTIPVTAAQQDISLPDTVFRAFSVAGDPNLSAANIRDGVSIFGVEGSMLPRPADCQADGGTGCVTVEDFPAVATSLLTAGNIKSTVVIGGITGDYPSAVHRLVNADATADLPVLGPDVVPDTYQFFDSAGNRYQTVIADGGTITPSTATQSISEAGTAYRGFRVAGDIALQTSNIRDSIEIFGVGGEINPSPSPCDGDQNTACLAVEGFPAVDKSLLLAENIRTGVNILDITGVYPSSDYPLASATDTQDLVSLGPTTDTGDYEFFDSSGHRLTVSVLEATNVSPSDEEQSFGTAGSVYRAFSVAGDANLLAINIREGITLFGVEGELIPRPADCQADGAIDCVTDEDFPAVATTLLTAGNIKAGVVIRGITGNYPSADHRLATADETDDLPALGPDLGVGTYQFFDSAGNRYQTVIADGGTITPTTTTQSFSELGTVYRGFSVAGDADLVASNIRDSLSIFTTAGELVPVPAECNAVDSLDCLAIEDYPAIAKSQLLAGHIRSGVQILDVTGAYPSSDHPLAEATATADLVSLGSTTDLGDYEFFDSTGHRLTVSILEASNIIASDEEQSFGTAGSVYRAFSVAGDANLLTTNIRDGVSIFGVEGELIPSPANCQADGATGCVTGEDFPAVSTNLLTAGNIKAGEVIGGVIGDYPSADHRLVSAEATDDLPALGPSMTLGTYQFFDSAGNRYQTVIADGGTITPSTATQSFSEAGTVYRGFSVAGDADLLASNIRDSVSIFTTSGALIPIPAACNADDSIGCLAVEDYPAIDKSQLLAGHIRTGVEILDITGAYPSNDHRLATAELTQDLTSLDPETDLGDYQFFDSAGNRLTVSILEATDIIAIDEEQSFGAAGSVYRTFSVAGDANFLATNIRNGVTLFGLEGELIPRPADCQTDGAIACVTDEDFPAVDKTLLTAGNIKAGEVIGGVTGDYPSADHRLVDATGTPDLSALGPTTPIGGYEFFDSAGNRFDVTVADGGTITPTTAFQSFGTANTIYRAYTVAGDEDLLPENIKDGVTILAVVGDVEESPGLCTSSGTRSCVAAGIYFAGTICDENSSNCFVPSYVESEQSLKAIDYDAIDPAKLLASLTIDEKTGSIVERGSWDLSTAYPGDGYYTEVSNTPAASLIVDTATILGVDGSIVPMPGNCDADTSTSCVTVAEFPAVDGSRLTPGNIRSGVNIGGVAGAYPSASYPLASHVPGSTDLENLSAQLISDDEFQFFTRAGARLTASGSSSLVAGNIRAGVNFFGINGDMPTIPLNFKASRTSDTEVQLAWQSSPFATGYLLVVSENAQVTFVPDNGSLYTAGLSFGNDEIIYVGAGTSFTHDGLHPASSYHYAIYGYNDSDFYSNGSLQAMVEDVIDCSDLDHGIWVKVPGNSTYGTKAFCLMKYEAKNASGVARSQAESLPWSEINQYNAKSQCESLGYEEGYRLISNMEWMTVATNILMNGANWSSGRLGIGSLNRGNSDESGALAADNDDANACVGITAHGNPSDDCNGGQWHLNKRTHTLSNGEVVWDIAGNVFQWMEETLEFADSSQQPKYSGAEPFWHQPFLVDTGFDVISRHEMFPDILLSNSWGNEHGMGEIFAGNGTGSRGIIRGNSTTFMWTVGVFAISTALDTNTEMWHTGFRCVKRSD